jgi:hypothetical protein
MITRIGLAFSLTIVLAACGASPGSAAHGKRPSRSSALAVEPTTTTPPLDPYNPTHDPHTCVQVLDNGLIVLTVKQPVPSELQPNPAAADEPIAPAPPLGKCG